VKKQIEELYHNRELLWMWTLREIRVRYKQSLLGTMWALLQPMALAAMFTLVFSYIVRVPTDGIPYPVFSYTALLPWSFLSTSISFGVPSLVNNMNLVTRIYFPREVLPLAAIAAAGVDFLVGSVVFVGMLLLYRMPFHPAIVLLPLLLLIQIVLTFGLVLAGSAAIVFFRDVRFVVPLALQLWLYASPVIYPSSLVPPRFRGMYYLNPMVGLLEGYRDILLYARWPEPGSLLLAALVAVVICLGSYWAFKRLEPRFADLI
jgi:homopolymeric O-antigen transport system permease protein